MLWAKGMIKKTKITIRDGAISIYGKILCPGNLSSFILSPET